MDSLEGRLKTLMLAALAGSSPAYQALLEACTHRLRNYFGRRLGHDSSDVEDLVQDTLVAIHQRRASYDVQLPFTAWLHAIARYKLIDHFRRSGIRDHLPLEVAEEIIASDEGDALAAIDVAHLLAELPAKQRRSIELTRIQGHSVAETAALTGQSESGVKVSVHRGLRRLMARVRTDHAGD